MENRKISVKNFKVTNIKPDITDKEIQQVENLLPKLLIPQNIEFELHGVNLGVANAIRRTILSNIKIKALDYNYQDMATSDEFIRSASGFLHRRIQLIQVLQTIPLDAKFSIDVKNDTEHTICIYTSHLKPQLKYYNDNIPIIELRPNCFLKIDNIHVVQGRQFDFGGYTAAIRPVCIPLDQVPLDMETNEGVSCLIANPRSHKIKFQTNGIMPAIKMLNMACEELLQNLPKIKAEKPIISGDLMLIKINNENHTLGNMVHMIITEQNSRINANCYDVDLQENILVFKLKLKDEDIMTIMKDAVDECVRCVSEIQKQFAKL